MGEEEGHGWRWSKKSSSLSFVACGDNRRMSLCPLPTRATAARCCHGLGETIQQPMIGRGGRAMACLVENVN